MALSLSISACFHECCSKLSVSDISGIYSALPNFDTGSTSTGWGVPNLAPSAVTTATLAITYPSGTTVTETVTSQVNGYTITIYQYLTFSDIDPTGSTFEDGLYTIVYTVTDGTTTYTTSTQVFNYCNAQCCVDTMWSKLPAKHCGCDYDDWAQRCLEASALLRGIRSAASCSNTAYIDTMLETLQTICEFNDCNCS